MSNNNQQQFNSQALPFFARYLETQFCKDLSEEEMDAVKGGFGCRHSKVNEPEQTSNPIIAVTLKYPSDQEEGEIISTVPSQDLTRKYPSDSDDYDVSTPVTLKYPSDSDESGIEG